MSERNPRATRGNGYQEPSIFPSEPVNTSNPLRPLDLFAPSGSDGVLHPTHPITISRLNEQGTTGPIESLRSGIYRLLQGVCVFPGGVNKLPVRALTVISPLNCYFPKGIQLSNSKLPKGYPITSGRVGYPVAADDYVESMNWHVCGDERDGKLFFYVDTSRRDLIIPQSYAERAATTSVYDMSPKRIIPQPKPTPVQPSQQVMDKRAPSPQVKAKTFQPNTKPRQRSFDFATQAPTIVSAKPPTEPDLRPRYKPKAGDRGSIQLSKKEIASLMPQLEISGAEETKGFWKPDKHILDFWNLVPDRKVQDKNGNPLKPFKSIPVVANGCIFIPYKIKILHVDGYPDGTNIQDFHDIDTFKRGAMITNHICAIPIGGNLHKWIIFPTNGSSSIGAAVPNRLGKYDNKSNNRCTLHPGSLISRSQDPLWCQFDAYSPGLSSIPFHLFHPGSRTKKSMELDHVLDPEQAHSLYQQHLRDEAARENAKINKPGSPFKWGRR